MNGITFYLIAAILTIHWFSDFVLQTRWQAENKSKNNVALSKHVGTYCLGFLGLLSVVFVCGGPATLSGIVLFVALNGALHWITDFVTSRCTSYFWAKKDTHTFFMVIGIDQLIHSLTLLATSPLLLK